MARHRRRRSRCHKSSFKGDLRKAAKSFLILPAECCCQSCGYDVWIGNLTFHHQDESTKKFNISEKLTVYSLRTLVKEAVKCILICHNCHGEVHAGLRQVNHIPTLNYSKMRIPVDALKWYNARQTRAR
jgi:hypothetical protein